MGELKMKDICCAIIVIVLLILIWSRLSKESMMSPAVYGTKCTDRGFCTTNESDEIRAASNIANSAANMDYTYSYWNGARRLSCDECPNSFVCPGCPRHRHAGPGVFDSPNIVHGINENINIGVDEKGTGVGSGYVNEYFIADDAHAANGKDTPNNYDSAFGKPSGQNFDHTAAVPEHDLDSEFLETRERMGAHTAGKRKTPSTLTAMTGEALGESSTDNKFDSAGGGMMLGRKACRPCESSAVKLLYTDVMGLTNPPPLKADCEYLGYNGYLYKEPCELGEQY